MRSSPRSYRPLIMGRRGAVATNHPLATQAGFDVLRDGGNAIDAAVAISFALGVVEPMSSGIGGDGFYHVALAGSSQSIVYNGTGAAPEGATVERYRKEGGIPEHGPLSTSIPCTVAGVGMMHRAHGKRPWSKLLDAAIEHARNGFAVTHAYASSAGDNRKILSDDPRSRKVFLDAKSGDAPAPGAVVVQPDLARSLEEIAADGAETMYRGRLAKRLAAACQARGVLLSERDLASCQAERQAPVAIAYRGYEVRQTPPNSTGFVLLQELKIAERFDLKSLRPGSAELVHIMVEARKRAFLDRERYGTDPRHGDVPLDRLLSDAYADECAAAIDRNRAEPTLRFAAAGGDTTYYCVVDGEGNAVSAIQSINSAFGSGVTAGDTGILLNNRMAYWHLEEGHANRLQPGKRVRHTMNAPLVVKDGKTWCVFGTPGADNQVQVNFQVLIAMIEHGYDPQQALEMPRWTSMQPGQAANYPHTGEDALVMEGRFAKETIEALKTKGHPVRVVGDLDGPCSVEAICVLENGVRMAGSDPRRDGWALAY
ncbi:MAG: gamma-glutamyltransferase [Proteobacteria bacterium]|nr:gamma-glutamyltransferase [Pseudomonadota bacterium]MBI3499219.1 gamma-glutamyltransferase [Pseudomonadota bacterium]